MIGEDFTFHNLRRVSQAVATYLKTQGVSNSSIPIGYDWRFLSEDFAKTVAEVLAGNGHMALLSKLLVPLPMSLLRSKK